MGIWDLQMQTIKYRMDKQQSPVCSTGTYIQHPVVQSLSCVQLLVTPRTAARQASLSSTISWSLLKLTSIESVTPSNHHIL